MFFTNYRKTNTLMHSAGIPLANRKEVVQKQEKIKDKKTGEEIVVQVDDLVGSYTDDATHKNIYIEACDTKDLGGGVHEVFLVETPKNTSRNFLYLEANPNALALGMIHSQIILKKDEEFKIYTIGDPDKLLLLDWVLKLSVIRGERN